MASVILFHSAYGLRPAVLAQAQHLRDAGHDVTTPDLFDGATFDDLDAGLALRDQIGWPGLVARATAAVSGLPPGQIYAGWSLGAGVGAYVALGAGPAPAPAGLLLFGCELDDDAVSALTVPAQIHAAQHDPWMDEDAVLAAAARGVEVFRYGGGHIFADPGLPDYDAPSAELLSQRVLAFLAGR